MLELIELSESHKELLNGLLERIIFNKPQSKELGALIKSLNLSEQKFLKLKDHIIESRAIMIEELVKVFPFYISQILEKRKLDGFINNDDVEKLKKEIVEKNKFLQKVGIRLNSLYVKMEKKKKEQA